MASMLMDCPQCHSVIAKGSTCPDCRWSDKTEEETEIDHATLREFARREKVHNKTYMIFMILKLATGVVAMFTGYMWLRVIYRGSVSAFLWIVLLTMLTAGLGVLLTCAKKFFPTALHCPGCDFQIDKLGFATIDCPNCSTQLK